MNNTTITTDSEQPIEKPGAQLAAQRNNLGYTPEYVAEKLRLRVRIIELLEQDDYLNMPEPVFIKGYLRAYAKLLKVPADPLLARFNQLHSGEHKLERALWQSRRVHNKAEHVVRWTTTLFALGVLIAVAMWWHASKENESVFSKHLVPSKVSSRNQPDSEIRLTDLSKMRSLLSSTGQNTAMENPSE